MAASVVNARESEVAIGYHNAKGLGNDEVELPVQGKIPSWINGTLYRTGPGVYNYGTMNIHHWFDGLGCVYRFQVSNGTVKYRSELVNQDVKAMNQRGKGIWFGQDICKGMFGKFMGMWNTGGGKIKESNVGVTVGPFPGKGIVVRTDSVLSVEIDPRSVKEKDRFTYEMINTGKKGDLVGDMAAAHAQYDVRRGEMWNFTLKLGPPPGGIYTMFKVTKNGAKCVTRLKRVPSYIHSFAMTENYVILILWPCQMHPLKVLYEKNVLGALHWKETETTKFYVIERQSSRHIATYESNPFFCFHTVNAYEISCGDESTKRDIVIDLCRYDDMEVVRSFRAEYLRTKEASFFPASYLTQFTLSDVAFAKCRGPLLLTRASERRLCDTHSIELPRYNSKLHMRPYTYTYGVSTRAGQGDVLFNGLVKINVQSGESKEWSEPHCYPGEPIFLANPESQIDEDDGVLLSVVLDAKQKTSFMLVLNAKDMNEIARAVVPQVVPFGFHGNFVAQS